jgi:hypothetical protein
MMEVFKYWLLSSVDDDEVYELEIVRKFKSHNVIKERVELYKDFTINLLHYIYESYLGSEFIKTEHDQRGHFTWAYGKVLEEFEDEGIDFYNNDDLFEYFYVYFKDQFYNMKKIEDFKYYHKFWLDIFDLSKNKQRKKFEVLLQIYEIFDESLVPNPTTSLMLI